jgi:hypothetical protein
MCVCLECQHLLDPLLAVVLLLHQLQLCQVPLLLSQHLIVVNFSESLLVSLSEQGGVSSIGFILFRLLTLEGEREVLFEEGVLYTFLLLELKECFHSFRHILILLFAMCFLLLLYHLQLLLLLTSDEMMGHLLLLSVFGRSQVLKGEVSMGF